MSGSHWDTYVNGEEEEEDDGRVPRTVGFRVKRSGKENRLVAI